MQIRAKLPKNKITVSCVLGEIQREPFLQANPNPTKVYNYYQFMSDK